SIDLFRFSSPILLLATVTGRKRAAIDRFCGGLEAFCPQSASLRRTLGAYTAHRSLRQHQVRQPKQGKELRLVLGQAPVAHLAMLKVVLHHMKRVLDLGAHL